MTPVEELVPGEHAAIGEMIRLLREQLTKRYLVRNRSVLRDAHPKHHGLVEASFIVDPDCPVELRHGLFSDPGRRRRAVIRFSNSHPIVNHDLQSDLRGIAIKLPDVQGSLLGEAGHDFVMATGEAFFGRDAVDFVEFVPASESTLKTVWYFLRRCRIRGGLQLWRANTSAASPLDAEYFSQTPYRLGPHCVKYQVRPAASRNRTHDPWYLKGAARRAVGMLARVVGWVGGPRATRFLPGFDALRESLASDLERSAVTLEFLVQRWPDLSTLPLWAIEDATRTWDAPWVRVATIEVHRQQDIPVGDEVERMTFTPWRALPAHQPLGSINRARLAIYREMSAFRNSHNLARVPVAAATGPDPSSVMVSGAASRRPRCP